MRAWVAITRNTSGETLRVPNANSRAGTPAGKASPSAKRAR